MQFEVYLDSLFLLNFMMNLYILLLLNRTFMGVSGGGRMILGATLGAVGFLLLFLIPAGGVLRFGIGVVVGTIMMLHIAFPGKLVRNRLKLWGRAIAITFFLGGGLLFLTRQVPFFRGRTKGVLFFCGVGLLLYLLYQNTLTEESFNERSCTGTVTVRVGTEKKSFPAFVDSGNHLYEPISGKPVCIASSQVIREILGEGSGLFRVVPYRSIGGKGWLKAYAVGQMQIELDGNTYPVERVYFADGEMLPFGAEDEKGVPGVILHPGLFGKRERKG
ncbi:MAG: sigma-E processing peptidase SpoIIGA [Acetatifactor sp.]